MKYQSSCSPRLWRDRDVPRLNDGVKIVTPNGSWVGDYQEQKRLMDEGVKQDGIKQSLSGPEWFDKGIAAVSYRSAARRAASAQIAKIPFPLAQHIAKVFKSQ